MPVWCRHRFIRACVRSRVSTHEELLAAANPRPGDDRLARSYSGPGSPSGSPPARASGSRLRRAPRHELSGAAHTCHVSLRRVSLRQTLRPYLRSHAQVSLARAYSQPRGKVGMIWLKEIDADEVKESTRGGERSPSPASDAAKPAAPAGQLGEAVKRLAVIASPAPVCVCSSPTHSSCAPRQKSWLTQPGVAMRWCVPPGNNLAHPPPHPPFVPHSRQTRGQHQFSPSHFTYRTPRTAASKQQLANSSSSKGANKQQLADERDLPRSVPTPYSTPRVLCWQVLPKVADIVIGINVKVYNYQTPLFAHLRQRMRRASQQRHGATTNIEVRHPPCSCAIPVVGCVTGAPRTCTGRRADLHRVLQSERHPHLRGQARQDPVQYAGGVRELVRLQGVEKPGPHSHTANAQHARTTVPIFCPGAQGAATSRQDRRQRV